MPYTGQSSIGKVSPVGRKDVDMGGYLVLAKVIKVHQKYNMADVSLINTKENLISSSANEGKFGARICTSNAHFDKSTGKSWGVVEPICEEDIVLVAFLENKKAMPIIIQSFHRLDIDENILTDEYPIIDPKDSLTYLRVFPSQNFIKIDGAGNTEISLGGKSFYIAKSNIDDSHGSLDFKDLSVNDKLTGDTRMLEEGSLPTDQSKDIILPDPEPKDHLLVFRDSLNDDNTTWTKIFISKNGTFRISRDRSNSISTIELADDGSINIKKDGSGKTLEISFDNDGVMTLSSSDSIKIQADRIQLNGNVNVTGNLNVEGDSSHIKPFWEDL